MRSEARVLVWGLAGWMNECGGQWGRSREAKKLLRDESHCRWLARATSRSLESRIGSHLGASGVGASERLQGCGPGSSGLSSWRRVSRGHVGAVESHVAGACLKEGSQRHREVQALGGMCAVGVSVSGPQTDQEREPERGPTGARTRRTRAGAVASPWSWQRSCAQPCWKCCK